MSKRFDSIVESYCEQLHRINSEVDKRLLEASGAQDVRMALDIIEKARQKQNNAAIVARTALRNAAEAAKKEFFS